MKNYALAVLACFALTSFAHAENPAVPPAHGKANLELFASPAFIGIKAARVESSTSPALAVSGQGLLYALCASSGAVTGHAIALDSAAASGNTMATTGKAITPAVFTQGLTPSSSTSTPSGCFIPPWPVRFTNGLVLVNSAADIKATAYYRLDDGTNP